MDNLEEKIEQLKALHAKGLIPEEVYKERLDVLLDQITNVSSTSSNETQKISVPTSILQH